MTSMPSSPLGVPDDLAACHTAELSGYVVEGHIPAAALKRLLAEKPKAAGLAVSGMPVGSPGMEGGSPRALRRRPIWSRWAAHLCTVLGDRAL